MEPTRARQTARRRSRNPGAIGEEEGERLDRGPSSGPALASPNHPIEAASIAATDVVGLGQTAGNRAVAGLIAHGRTSRIAALQRQCVDDDDPIAMADRALKAHKQAMALHDAAIALAEEAHYARLPDRIGLGMGWGEGQSAGGGGATGRPMLRKGSRGAAVVDLQERLNQRGADPGLVADGIFGTLTKAAVIAFQSRNGLVPDGIVGPLTWDALTAEKPDIPPDVDPLEGLPVQVLGHGASEAAVAAARVAAAELFGGMRDPSRAQLMKTNVALDVIPHDKQLTDLPEYAHLKGTKTFDGRIWDTVRGIQTTIDGVHRFAIAEEDLISVPGTAAGYGSGFLAAHEGGHALQASSLTPAQLSTLVSLHSTRLAASGPITADTPASDKTAMWLNPAWYSAANKEEYFANSVAAYLGHPYTNGDADQMMYNRSWLSTNDPGMYTLLQSIYTQ